MCGSITGSEGRRLDLIAGFFADALVGGLLRGTGAVLIKVFNLNRCDPTGVGRDSVALLGLAFWIVLVLIVGRQF
jgi:hypothetical protein